jgi:hypothetical protein
MAFYSAYQLKPTMEAVKNYLYFPSDLPPEEVIALFFESYSRETMRDHSFYLFKCWVTNSCGIKENLPDQEIALFLDQLIDLVAAAFTLHQANRVSKNPEEGKNNG